jgi:hypothetical protein
MPASSLPFQSQHFLGHPIGYLGDHAQQVLQETNFQLSVCLTQAFKGVSGQRAALDGLVGSNIWTGLATKLASVCSLLLPLHIGSRAALGTPQRSCQSARALFVRPLAATEAADDLIPINMDVFADEDRLGGELASELRSKGLKVKAATGEVEHMWKGAAG